MYRQFCRCVVKHRTYFAWLAVMAAVLLASPVQLALAQDCNDENCPAGCCGDTCCEESETCCNGSCCATTCCGTTCLSTGQSCCNGQPYSTATQGCCNGQIYTLATHCCVEGQVEAKCGTNCCTSSESCCGNTTCYDPATQGCCNGVVYSLATHACCDGVVYNKTTHACCAGVAYNKTTHGCCNDIVYNKTTQGCCDGVVYNKSTHCCYNNVVRSKVDTTGDGTNDCCVLPTSTWAELSACPGTASQPSSYTPPTNGCSSPFGNNPCGLANTSFLNACNSHDTAYGTCGTTQAAADTAFLNAMTAVCNAAGNPSCGLTTCQYWANLYYNAVNTLGGTAYQNAQVASCVCCVAGT